MGRGPNPRNFLTLFAVWAWKYPISLISPRIANALACHSMKDSQIEDSDQVGAWRGERIALLIRLKMDRWLRGSRIEAGRPE
jgi:hypothetical protein